MTRDPDTLWSAAQAAAASADFAELQAAHGGLLWVAFEPSTAGCGLFFWRDGQLVRLTPPGFSVRSRVYEYGGGASCASAGGVAFVNEDDQQIYHLELPAGGGAASAMPRALTASPGRRYGELSFVAPWRALLALEESHEDGSVNHRLVRIGLDGAREVLCEGADFYAGAVASADGQRLAWIEWDRPGQPWLATRLCLREADGRQRLLAGASGEEALQQPRFDHAGRLWVISDRHGWWRPYCCEEGMRGHGGDFEHAPAPWQLGLCSYLPGCAGELLSSRFEQGQGVLLEVDAHGNERRLAPAFSRFRSLAADAGNYYCIAAAPDRLPAVLAIARDDGAVRVLAGGASPLAAEHLSWPRPLSFAVSADEQCHGFLYPAVHGERQPPLLVFLHGGPTSASYPVFDPRIAFWTLRGFAVLDLNYRGSSGHGRAYRLRLAGQWGALEVEDIRAAIARLASQALIDPTRVFVRGASAGGYSALLALAGIPGLRGGASLYGVTDPQALRRVTHKFEGDYLDWLLGDPQRDAERYRQRTPLHQAGRIAAPVIFFQGGQDPVVLPAQTESMVAAMRQRGMTVAYQCYADERHGFRQATNIADALQREYRFYQALLAD